MALFKTITQGGQVHIHQLHMLKQIFVAGILVAFLAGGCYFVWKSSSIPSQAWRMTYEVYWAKFMLATNPVVNHKIVSQIYTPLKGKSYRRSSMSILHDPVLKKVSQHVEKILEQLAYESLKFATWAFIATMVFWFFFGREQQRAKYQRGTTLVPWKKLKRMITRKNEDSDLKLGDLPLLKDKETSHLLITGTTGSGKTNAFHILLPQIRQRKDRAIIMDVTGNYVSRYYNEKTDLLLNPLDMRSLTWTPWADCHLDSHYDVLSESFIQTKNGTKDPFWDNASRALLKTALRKYAFQGEADLQKLYAFLLGSSSKEFEAFFKGTEAATFASQDNEKTTHSIRSVLSSQIECLHQLETTDEAFSIRKWVMESGQRLSDSPLPNSQEIASQVKDPNGWLFITARPDQRETLRPLISAWMDIAINALMVLPENQKRRLWFVIDELTALQRLPRLPLGLAEGRKYGGCFLVGFQSKPQLEEIYGRNQADSMLDLFNTKVFFRCTEPSTQMWISKVLGDKEEAEPQENISYGAHSMRDGVSLTRHTRQKPLIMPAELSQLEDLEAYIKLPGDYPSTKIQMNYQGEPSSLKEPFLLKPEKMREYPELKAVEKPSEEEEDLV